MKTSAPPGVSIIPPVRMRAPGWSWDHEIQVALPPSYNNSDQRFPVLWVTDGLYCFETAVNVVNIFAKKHLPEMIVVGIGTPRDEAKEHERRRMFDFTPNEGWEFSGFGDKLFERELIRWEERSQKIGIPFAKEHGGAKGFLSFLLEALRSTLAKDYRFAESHALFGNSGGGLFCAYALFARPDAFDKFICGSPALNWGRQRLFHIEEEYAAANADLPANVFFGAGEGEIAEGEIVSAYGIVSSMVRMAEILRMRVYPSFKMHVRVFPGEDHLSVLPLNLMWGLRALWQDHIPPK